MGGGLPPLFIIVISISICLACCQADLYVQAAFYILHTLHCFFLFLSLSALFFRFSLVLRLRLYIDRDFWFPSGFVFDFFIFPCKYICSLFFIELRRL